MYNASKLLSQYLILKRNMQLHLRNMQLFVGETNEQRSYLCGRSKYKRLNVKFHSFFPSSSTKVTKKNKKSKIFLKKRKEKAWHYTKIAQHYIGFLVVKHPPTYNLMGLMPRSHVQGSSPFFIGQQALWLPENIWCILSVSQIFVNFFKIILVLSNLVQPSVH